MSEQIEDGVEMEIFRSGDYGAKGRYSEADLQALAEDYRPELLEAPLTFDHAQRGPAYGWVERLRVEGTGLIAVLRGVPETVRDLVRKGGYRRRSIELIRKLKETGRPYLRAVTLLGAATPEVKGLKPIAFREDEPGGAVIVSTEPINGEPGQAAATTAVDSLLGSSTEADAAQAELQELHGTIAQLRRDLRAHSADTLFAELRAKGYCLLERDATALRHLVEFCEGETVCFGEGDTMPVLDWLGAYIRATALRVPLGSDTEHETVKPSALHFSESSEAICPRTHPRSVELHHRALALLSEQPGLAYAEALARVA